MEHPHQIVGKFVFGWFKHTFFVEKKNLLWEINFILLERLFIPL